MSYIYTTGQWPAIQWTINHNSSSIHPAVNEEKPHNSKTAYVSKICYTSKCAPSQYLHGGSRTIDGAPIVLEKRREKPQYSGFLPTNTAIEAVSSWMSSNRLCLNLDKTKYLWFGTRQQLGQRDTVALSNISAAMVSDTVTRNLGLLLDQELSMVDHITKLSQVCFFHLRRIRVVRHSLTHNIIYII